MFHSAFFTSCELHTKDSELEYFLNRNMFSSIFAKRDFIQFDVSVVSIIPKLTARNYSMCCYLTSTACTFKF